MASLRLIFLGVMACALVGVHCEKPASDELTCKENALTSNEIKSVKGSNRFCSNQISSAPVWKCQKYVFKNGNAVRGIVNTALPFDKASGQDSLSCAEMQKKYDKNIADGIKDQFTDAWQNKDFCQECDDKHDCNSGGQILPSSLAFILALMLAVFHH